MSLVSECLLCGQKIEPGDRIVVDRQSGGTNGNTGRMRLASLHERCWGTVAHILRVQRAKEEKSAREMSEAIEMAERFERLGAPS